MKKISTISCENPRKIVTQVNSILNLNEEEIACALTYYDDRQFIHRLNGIAGSIDISKIMDDLTREEVANQENHRLRKEIERLSALSVDTNNNVSEVRDDLKSQIKALEAKIEYADQKLAAVRTILAQDFVANYSHVVLRFKADNLNLYRPFIDESNNDTDIKKSLQECGFEVEKEFFKHPIDWYATVYYLDAEYCEKYLENIFNENYV
ncbi:unnamed protein product [Brachionus calyciflorus]|uniref:Uncharacterized protein n=1 Tax=Brachionus calyciflorus TaxID=104777 RepID=A0A814IS05_9BILA|nr:unnamed protein product [Brachionus calyciflorus]